MLACLVLWGAAVSGGFWVAHSYASTPGERAPFSGSEPVAARSGVDPRRPTLVVAAHPHCPCTSATLASLDRIAARCPGRANLQVLLYSDPGLGAGWERTRLWERAAAIPGTEVLSDPLGAECARLGARTSGHVFLFAPGGELLFEGGITAGRGHEGDNPGSSAVVDLLLHGSARIRSAPVFGCALANRGDP
jgi:hypothetical protein